MYFALGFIALFTIGGLSGMTHAAAPSDLQQTDTYYIVAHIHYVLFGGAIMGLMGGIFYWYPKMTGRMMNDYLGKWTFWLIFPGHESHLWPDALSGPGWHAATELHVPRGNGLGFLEPVRLAQRSVYDCGRWTLRLQRLAEQEEGRDCGARPVGTARTLEWAMPSPPPHYNFVEIPVVHGRDALWEQKYPEEGHAPHPVPAVAAHDDDEHGHDIHMPSPSYYPLIVALGIFSLAVTLLLYQAFAPLGFASGALGIVLLLWGAYGWVFEPTD